MCSRRFSRTCTTRARRNWMLRLHRTSCCSMLPPRPIRSTWTPLRQRSLQPLLGRPKTHSSMPRISLKRT
eukprot:31214_6